MKLVRAKAVSEWWPDETGHLINDFGCTHGGAPCPTCDEDKSINPAQPPARWSESLKAAFWAAVNAPTYEANASATLAFAHDLAEKIRADGIGEWEGMSDTARAMRAARITAADLIDPAVET